MDEAVSVLLSGLYEVSRVHYLQPWVLLLLPEANFCHLDIPVTELIPQEVINLLYCDSKLIFVHVVCNFTDHCIELERSDLSSRQSSFKSAGSVTVLPSRFIIMNRDAFQILFAKLRLDSTRSQVKTHVVPRCISCDQCQTKCICAVFINNFQRIDTISKRFTHLRPCESRTRPSSGSMVEWNFSCLLKSGEYHTDNPEEDNVVSC